MYYLFHFIHSLQDTLFLEEFFDNIRALNYPREKMDVYISCQSQKRSEFVQKIAKSWIKDKIYHSVTLENQYKGKLTTQSKLYLKFIMRWHCQKIQPFS